MTEVSERHVLWTQSAGDFEEWVRYQDRILSQRGVNNGWMRRVGLRFPSESEAAAFLESVKANPTSGYTPSEPWYVPGRGEIARTWYRGSVRLLAGPVGHKVGDRSFDSWEETVAWLEQYDLETWRDHGGRVTRVEWMDNRRRDDWTLPEILKDRWINTTTTTPGGTSRGSRPCSRIWRTRASTR